MTRLTRSPTHPYLLRFRYRGFLVCLLPLPQACLKDSRPQPMPTSPHYTIASTGMNISRILYAGNTHLTVEANALLPLRKTVLPPLVITYISEAREQKWKYGSCFQIILCINKSRHHSGAAGYLSQRTIIVGVRIQRARAKVPLIIFSEWKTLSVIVSFSHTREKGHYRPNQSSGFSLTVSLRNWKCRIVLPEESVEILPRTSFVFTCCPFFTEAAERLQYTEM